MTPTKIAAKNGKARPKNPYDNEFKDEYHFYAEFESTFQWHDCPEATEDGEYMGELVWQYYGCKVGGSGPFWLDVEKDTYKLYKSFEHYHSFHENHRWGTAPTRQVWRIVPQPQEKQNMENQDPLISKLINAAKYGYEYHRTTQFPELSFNENCRNNFLQYLQGQYPVSVVEKEEAKTVEALTPNTALDILKDFDCLSQDGRYIKKNMSCEKVIFAMVKYGEMRQAYSSQQNTALMEENTRLREVLESFVNDHALGYTVMTDFMISQANEAIKPKQ